MNIGHVQNYKIINCSWKINVLVLIRAYWWENWSEINKRTGAFFRNSRVLAILKDLNLLQKYTKNQKASYNFRLGFALSKSPYFISYKGSCQNRSDEHYQSVEQKRTNLKFLIV